MARVVKTFPLDTERDADILEWLARQTNQSEAIRGALRAALGGSPEITLAEVYRAVLDLSNRVQVGSVVPSEPRNGDVPGTEQAAMALDRLGL